MSRFGVPARQSQSLSSCLGVFCTTDCSPSPISIPIPRPVSLCSVGCIYSAKRSLLNLANVCPPSQLGPMRRPQQSIAYSMMWPRVRWLHCPCVQWLAFWPLGFRSTQVALQFSGSLHTTQAAVGFGQATCQRSTMPTRLLIFPGVLNTCLPPQAQSTRNGESS